MSRPDIVIVGLKDVLQDEGGVEKGARVTASILATRGYRVFIYSRSNAGHRPVRLQRRCTRIPVPFVPSKYMSYYSYMLRVLLLVLARHNRFRTVVHVHSPCMFGLLVLFLRIARFPVVTHSHGLEWQAAKWPPWWRPLLKIQAYLGIGLSRHALFVARHEKVAHGRLLRAGALHSTVAVNGCASDSPEQRPAPLPDPCAPILFVGRLAPQKRVEDLIAAYRLSGLDRPLIVVGDTTFTDHYVARLRELACECSSVQLIGHLAPACVRSLIQRAHVVVLPSSHEGCPNVVLEAIENTIPVLVSDIPAHRDVDRRLWRFPVGDIETLAAQLLSLENDEETYARYTRIIADILHTWPSWHRVVDRYETAYADALAQTGHLQCR